MPDEKPAIHIDTDWKKQAQEEKRRLVEEAEKKKQSESAAPRRSEAAGSPAERSASSSSKRQLPSASFASIVQSLMTQALFYLGDIATSSGEGGVNLDLAKHHIDSLGILEEKTKGNLSPEEQKFLDAALYETRMRFVAIAGQMINP